MAETDTGYRLGERRTGEHDTYRRDQVRDIYPHVRRAHEHVLMSKVEGPALFSRQNKQPYSSLV